MKIFTDFRKIPSPTLMSIFLSVLGLIIVIGLVETGARLLVFYISIVVFFLLPMLIGFLYPDKSWSRSILIFIIIPALPLIFLIFTTLISNLIYAIGIFAILLALIGIAGSGYLLGRYLAQTKCKKFATEQDSLLKSILMGFGSLPSLMREYPRFLKDLPKEISMKVWGLGFLKSLSPGLISFFLGLLGMVVLAGFGLIVDTFSLYSSAYEITYGILLSVTVLFLLPMLIGYMYPKTPWTQSALFFLILPAVPMLLSIPAGLICNPLYLLGAVIGLFGLVIITGSGYLLGKYIGLKRYEKHLINETQPR